MTASSKKLRTNVPQFTTAHQFATIETEVRQAIERVLDSNWLCSVMNSRRLSRRLQASVGSLTASAWAMARMRLNSRYARAASGRGTR